MVYGHKKAGGRQCLSPACVHGNMNGEFNPTLMLRELRLFIKQLAQKPEACCGENVGGYVAAKGGVPAIAVGVLYQSLQVALVSKQVTLVLPHHGL